MRQGSERNSGSSEVPKGGILKENTERRRARVTEALGTASSKRSAVKQVRWLVRLLHNTVPKEATKYVPGREPDQEKSITLGLIYIIFRSAVPEACEVRNSENIGTVGRNHVTSLKDEMYTRTPRGAGLGYLAMLCRTLKQDRKAVRKLLDSAL